MNLRRLKYFVKIVDIGSLTQAAEVLHIAQPALSQQVATLEGEMDQQLLIRTKRGVTPTEAGKILYTHARTILRQCEQAQLAVNNVGQTLRGQVSIGLAPGTAASATLHLQTLHFSARKSQSTGLAPRIGDYMRRLLPWPIQPPGALRPPPLPPRLAPRPSM